jgi:selenoprotein W-related protein
MAVPRIEIEYCRRCRFQLRAVWIAQELLTTFEAELAEVALIPSGGGVLEVKLDGEVIASNREGNSLPDIAHLKKAIRDRVAPDRRIGHETGPD